MQKIIIHSESINLGQFLKYSGVISNGGEAKFFLSENDIKVNDIEEYRRGRKLFSGDIIEINGVKYFIEKE